MTTTNPISGRMTRRLLLPVAYLALLIGFYIFYNVRLAPRLSEALHTVFKKGLHSLVVLSVAFIFHRISSTALAWYKDNIAVKTASKLDDELIPLARRALSIVIWIVAFLVILPLFGVNISALIAALGVTSLAIALAAQDTIANFIAGFLIMIDRPFREGDRIKLPSGELVTVLDIGVRRSRFLAEDQSIVIVPNLDLSKSKIINYTYGEERRAGGAGDGR
jgi:MscS family membrane protein